jgi:predicted phage terminase large subunit-like protein
MPRHRKSRRPILERLDADPIGIKPVSIKLERLEAQTAKIEAGHLRIPVEAHWLGPFLSEMLAFPNARHIRSTAFRNSCNGPPST